MSAPLDAQSRMPRAVIALECRAAEAHLPGACDALKAALRAALPGAVQRVMNDLSDAPARPGDLALALEVNETTVRLDWRHGAGLMHRGVDMARPRGAAIRPLIDALLGQSPGPLDKSRQL